MFNYEKNQEDDLDKAIIKMITFFDLFAYPLTAYEIYSYLDKRSPLFKILHILPELKLIEQKNGFYFLTGREEIITTRQTRHNYSVRKLKIARRFSRLFSLLPFVKVVALANSLGQHNLRDGSDIDFFIITAPRRIWLSRLYCTGLAKLLHRRPTAKTKKDKLCLSFYLAEDHLNLADLKLAGGDPYFEYWQRSLVLLYNKKRTYEDFLAANQSVPFPPTTTAKINSPRKFCGNFLEEISRRLQLTIMAPELKGKINQNSGVVINDSVLKLYLIDRRQEFLIKYEKKLQQLF